MQRGSHVNGVSIACVDSQRAGSTEGIMYMVFYKDKRLSGVRGVAARAVGYNQQTPGSRLRTEILFCIFPLSLVMASGPKNVKCK